MQLAVPYVPQSHLACVPATLAALCQYWGDPVDPEKIAAAICYDGTPDHQERSWAEQHGYKVQLMEQSEGEQAGIKSVELHVKGPYAFGYLKVEAGSHRLVRPSPFNAQGKRQTSFAGVKVAPVTP